MAVFRLNKSKSKGFTIIYNEILKDEELSLGAVGLLIKMISLPDDWNYSIKGLVAICKDGETKITNYINELINVGYIVRTKLNPNQTKTGRIEYIYDIYEEKTRLEKQGVVKQGTEEQGIEEQGTVFHGTYIINNNKINNNKVNNNIINNNIKNSKSEYDEEFELLWSKYPNKKGKDNAKRDFIKARKNNVSYSLIEQGLDNYIKYIQLNKVETRYIAHGSTWFHQQRWNDEYTNKDAPISAIINNSTQFKEMLEKGLI